MPVNLSNIGRHKTVAALAKSILGGRAKADLLKQAEEALLRANPGLGEKDGLKPGAPIIVPDLSGPAGAEPAEFALPAEAMRLASAAAGAFASQAGAPLDALLKESADQASLLKKANVLAAIAERRPDLRTKMPQIVAEIEAEANRAKEAAVKLRAAIAQMETLLPSLPSST